MQELKKPKTKFEIETDDIATERKLQEAAAAAEDAFVESLSLACSLIEIRPRPEFPGNQRTGGLSFQAAWPEGAAAKKRTQEWCKEKCVPCLREDSDGTHREHNTTFAAGFRAC